MPIRARSSCRSTGIHTQAAIGQGSGIFGTLRKMSTNQTSSTYQAVDKLRPAEAFTLAFPGTPARLNLFLQNLAALQLGRRHRQRQRLDRRPGRRCARVSGMGLRLLLQAVRPARHGRPRRRGRRHRAPARALRGKPAAARRRRHVHQQRVLLLRRPSRVRRRRRPPLHLSRRRLRRRRARMDARRHRLHLEADLSGRVGRAERSVLRHHGRGDGVLLPAGRQRQRSGRLADRRRRLPRISGLPAIAQQPRRQGASRITTACAASSGRAPTMEACTST